MDPKNAPDQGQQADESLEDALAAVYDAGPEGELDDGGSMDDGGGENTIIDEGELDVEGEGGQKADEQEVHEDVRDIVDEGDYNEPAPERWPNEIKEVYNSLPPAARKAMLEGVYKPMQKTYTQTTQDLAAQRKRLGPMLDALDQHSADFERAGVNPVEAFQRQLAWSAHFAKVGPEQGAKDLAKAYNQAGGQQADGGDKKPDIYMTPVEKAQQERLERLEGKLTARERQDQERQQQRQQDAFRAQANQVRNTIGEFANESKDGRPLHPHVEKVSGRMAGLIRGGVVERVDANGQQVPFHQQLSQAYELACRLENLQPTGHTRTRREQVEKVTAANRNVTSKTPGHDPVEQTGNLADSLSDLYDRLDRSAA